MKYLFGPSTILTKEEEEALELLCKMADMGFRLGREDVTQTAFTTAKRSGKKYPFKDSIARHTWMDGFTN